MKAAPSESLPAWVPVAAIGAVSAIILGLAQPHLLLSANTPTGGDMGAHVLGPAILRDVLLPSGTVLGWSDAWFAGFPAFYFYFPLPSLVIVLLDLVLPYGVAFKIVTIAGLVATPAGAYALARSLGLDRFVATVAGIGGGTFIMIESFAIFGANMASTMAGEFSYSWSFALGLFYLAVLLRAVRDDPRLVPWASLLLALTALSHVITTIMFVVATIPVLFWKNGSVRTVTTWAWGFAVSAFWALPLLARIGYTADMAWSPLRAWDEIFPVEVWMLLPAALVGLVWTARRRETSGTGPIWIMMMLPAAYFWLPWLARELEIFDGTWKLWNGRLLPFWFFGLAFFAGIGVAAAARTVARRLPERLPPWVMLGWVGVAGIVGAFWRIYPDARWWAFGIGGLALLAFGVLQWSETRLPTTVTIAVFAGLFVVAQSVAGVSFIAGWARWNFSGYEAKPGFSEYQALMNTIDTLPPGRIQWEANNEMDRQYGTPMALMLFPYWSTDHPSMEGLYFESSLTTPFHFLNTAEVSRKPSNPIPGLRYRTFDFDRAVGHLATYDVDYYVSFTEEATEAAREHESFTEVAVSPPFTVFELPPTDRVEVATRQPVVFELPDRSPLDLIGTEEVSTFHDVALEWYDDVSRLRSWVTEDGPADWPRIDDLAQLEDAARLLQPQAPVRNIEQTDGRLSFTTSAVGVPHLVKVSYFPNWVAEGADGPYRAAPSLMVVVPNSENVVLEFRRSIYEWAGLGLTAVGLGGLLTAALVAWRRRRAAA